MRKVEMDAGRSINLALSDRGLRALRRAGMEDEIRKECIPMRGRLIHPKEGDVRFSPYSGREEDYINSVSRGGLNIALLDKAESYPNAELFFDHKCESVDLENGTCVFSNRKTGEREEFESEVVIGTDGAGSAVRRSLMSRTTDLLFNYSQDFLRHGYKELSIPPAEGGGFRIEKNALHIWPRGGFMVIALPNLDGSFTVTMFHPFAGEWGFNALDTPEKVMAFFYEEFPDIIPQMPTLLDDYFGNPTGALGTIKCYPWQAFGKVCVMGDASHAIVPFYGQGMNASFEDVTVFDEILEKHEGDWERIFTEFQDARKENTDAIADLAIDNFVEMRDLVDDEDFIQKRKLEMQLEQAFPEYFSKYSLVTFNEDMPYAVAMRQGREQDRLLLEMVRSGEAKKLGLEGVFKKIVS